MGGQPLFRPMRTYFTAVIIQGQFRLAHRHPSAADPAARAAARRLIYQAANSAAASGLKTSVFPTIVRRVNTPRKNRCGSLRPLT